MRIETPYFIMFLLVGTRMLAAEASDKSCYFGRENLIENKPQKMSLPDLQGRLIVWCC